MEEMQVNWVSPPLHSTRGALRSCGKNRTRQGCDKEVRHRERRTLQQQQYLLGGGGW